MLVLRQVVGLNTWLKAVILLVLLWGFPLYIFASKLFMQGFSEQDMTFPSNMTMQSLKLLKGRSDEVVKLIDEPESDQPNQPPIDTLESKLQYISYSKREPSMEYEKLRRRIRLNTEELWNYFSSEFNKLKEEVSIFDKPELIDEVTNVMELVAEHKRSLISNIDQMRIIDGYEQWRHDEAKSLSDLVQRRLNYLQNPPGCKNARKLICRLNKACGYGCQLHHIVYCFILAYATERTLILKSKGWKYHNAGWEEIFHPVSETCLDIDPATHVNNWPGQNDSQVILVTIIDKIKPRPPYLPLAIPADLAPRLMRLHGEPIIWWIGQFLKYLLRARDPTHERLETRMEKLGFRKPIVGVHVRGTDKINSEAAFHSIEEYMTYVEDYFLQLEMNDTNITRRVFLATDEESIIDEAKEKYPSYEIIGDPDVAKMAKESTRYTDSSLNGIISDIHMLSLCDYLVCTFSSQVCRVAYEIMQTMYPDASNRFKSLDDIYYFGGQHAHNREAILSHHPRHHDELYMNAGDQIGIAGNHWNGYSKGINTRTNQRGLFPSFKVNDKVQIAEFPTYDNVK